MPKHPDETPSRDAPHGLREGKGGGKVMQRLSLTDVTIRAPGGLALQTKVFAWIVKGFVPDAPGKPKSFSGPDGQDLLAASITALSAQIWLESLVARKA